MRRKNFMLTVAAAAVLGAFNPALAQDSSTYSVNPNVGVDAKVGIGNTDQGAATGQASGSGSAEAQAGTTGSGASAEGSASGDASISASNEDEERRGKARGHDPDKLTGLDRADQVAGEHGRQGRDNAREKQGLN